MFNLPKHLCPFSPVEQNVYLNFGQVMKTTDPRTMEFALQVYFLTPRWNV